MWERLRSGRDNFVQTQGSFPVLRDRYRVLFSLCRGGWPSDDITLRLVSAISLSEGVVGRENEGIPDSHSRTL
jgi:hypothetical protein